MTTTYTLKSNFLPPMRSGSWTYRETMYDSVLSFSALRSSAVFHLASGPSLALYPVKHKVHMGKQLENKKINSPLLHFLICVSLLMRKMPLPCALPIGFMIHVLSGARRNSSTNRE